jgi:hypothetical protein
MKDPDNTTLLTGSIIAVMVGAVLIVVTYVILNAVLVGVGTITNAAMNASLFANISVISQALTLTGIALIIGGLSGIVYMLFSVTGTVTQKRGKS